MPGEVVERDRRFLSEAHVAEIGLVHIGLHPHLVERSDSIQSRPRLDRRSLDDVLLDHESACRRWHGDALGRRSRLLECLDLAFAKPEEMKSLPCGTRERFDSARRTAGPRDQTAALGCEQEILLRAIELGAEELEQGLPGRDVLPVRLTKSLVIQPRTLRFTSVSA